MGEWGCSGAGCGQDAMGGGGWSAGAALCWMAWTRARASAGARARASTEAKARASARG